MNSTSGNWFWKSRPEMNVMQVKNEAQRTEAGGGGAPAAPQPWAGRGGPQASRAVRAGPVNEQGNIIHSRTLGYVLSKL